MNRPRTAVLFFLAFLGGVAVGALAPWIVKVSAARLLFPETRSEVARVTSPDGVVDAVALRIDCGAPCSSAYAVSVVPKGTFPPKNSDRQFFLADEITNPQIRWKESHLLDIAYDRASIGSFRNVVYPLGKVGAPETWHYAVEARLSPSSPSFSYLRGPTASGLAHP